MNTRGLTRPRILALGLGLGTAAVCAPAIASADSSDWLSSIDSLASGVSLPAADSSGLNLAISVDGISLLQLGTATADSGADGDIAIANGAGASAYAYGANDYSLVAGTDSTGWAGGFNPAGATGSAYDLALIFGNNNTAFAGGDGNPGTLDYAIVSGSNDGAYAGGNADGAGNVDLAYVDGDNLGIARAQGMDYLVHILKYYGPIPTASTAAGAESGHVLSDVLPATGAATDSSNFLTDLAALFDPATYAGSGTFLTDLASLF